jgi:hypothetical protein
MGVCVCVCVCVCVYACTCVCLSMHVSDCVCVLRKKECSVYVYENGRSAAETIHHILTVIVYVCVYERVSLIAGF